jgi:hypothetical protein
MFVDKYGIDENHYILLMFLLNTTREAGYSAAASDVLSELAKVMSEENAILTIKYLGDQNLIGFSNAEGSLSYDYQSDGRISLSFGGLAFLLNYANEYLERINDRYGDVPENLTATLIPYVGLKAVPCSGPIYKYGR